MKRLAGWLAAALAVPAVVAGGGTLLLGQGIGAELGRQADDALSEAGVPGVSATVDGLDLVLDGVPAGLEERAVEAVAALPGIGSAQVGSVRAPEPTSSGTTAAAGPGKGEPTPGAATGPGREELVAGIAAAGPVQFGPDDAALAGQSAAAVARVGALLATAPAVRVRVEGFVADTPGSTEVAQNLSTLRAAAVADALVAAGVARERITAVGLGAQRQLATAAASRRVEIGIP